MIIADKQTGRSMRDICSLQITSSKNMTSINHIHHQQF